jgi:hypothetical protein
MRHCCIKPARRLPVWVGVRNSRFRADRDKLYARGGAVGIGELTERGDLLFVTVRLPGTDDDVARKLNRPENVRPISPTDPDFARLYPRRNDAESINRNLDDTLWLRRAHSIGHDRQHLNLLGYALMVNGLALHRHRRRHPTTLAA